MADRASAEVATMRQQHEDHMHAVDEIMTALGIRRRRRHSLETKGRAIRKSRRTVQVPPGWTR